MKKSQVRKDMAKMFVEALKEKPYSWSKGFSDLASPVNGLSGKRYGSYNRNREWEDPAKIKVKKGESPVYIDSSFFIPTGKDKEQGLKPIGIREYMMLEDEEMEI